MTLSERVLHYILLRVDVDWDLDPLGHILLRMSIQP